MSALNAALMKISHPILAVGAIGVSCVGSYVFRAIVTPVGSSWTSSCVSHRYSHPV